MMSGYAMRGRIHMGTRHRREEIRELELFGPSVKEMYDNKCVVSGADIESCQVCHIDPHSESDSSSENSPFNTLVLDADLHQTFDKHIWSINPNTLRIEIRSNYQSDGNNPIDEYIGKKVELFDVEKSRPFLVKRYIAFLQKLL